MMTMYDPVFPTIKQVVTSVKKALTVWRARRAKVKRVVHVSALPQHLRDDLDLEVPHRARPNASDYLFRR